MAKKTGSSIGIGTLIFWAIMGYMWFNDGDDDKKEVKIVDQPKAVIEETTKQKSIDLTKLKEEGTKIFEQVVEKVKEELEEKEVVSAPDPEPEKKHEKEEPPVISAEPEKKIEDKPSNKGMKKL